MVVMLAINSVALALNSVCVPASDDRLGGGISVGSADDKIR